MDEMENSTQKNSHGPLLIAVAVLLVTAIAGVNYLSGQKSGAAAQSSAAISAAEETSGAAAGGETGPGASAAESGEQDTRPMLSPPPGETGSVETEAAPEKNAEVVEQLPGAETQDPEAGPGVIVAQDENYGKVVFEPHCVDSTKPSRLIASTGIEFNGKRLKDDADYTPWYEFEFGKGEDYHDLHGVVTFRGNNWRDDPTSPHFRRLASRPVRLSKGAHVLLFRGYCTGYPPFRLGARVLPDDPADVWSLRATPR